MSRNDHVSLRKPEYLSVERAATVSTRDTDDFLN